MAERVYDLEERLLDYSVLIIRICEKLPNSRAGNHVACQLIRSGTSALPNHGEAQSAESPSDFIHKIKVALKELRESIRWLRLIRKVPLVKEFSEVDTLISETDELIRIFVKSVDTARKRSQKSA